MTHSITITIITITITITLLCLGLYSICCVKSLAQILLARRFKYINEYTGMRRRLSLNERANVLLLHSCEKRRKKRKKDRHRRKK